MKLRCPCGKTKGLSQHITMVKGWVTLERPMCTECRERLREQMEQEGKGA